MRSDAASATRRSRQRPASALTLIAGVLSTRQARVRAPLSRSVRRRSSTRRARGLGIRRSSADRADGALRLDTRPGRLQIGAPVRPIDRRHARDVSLGERDDAGLRLRLAWRCDQARRGKPRHASQTAAPLPSSKISSVLPGRGLISRRCQAPIVDKEIQTGEADDFCRDGEFDRFARQQRFQIRRESRAGCTAPAQRYGASRAGCAHCEDQPISAAAVAGTDDKRGDRRPADALLISKRSVSRRADTGVGDMPAAAPADMLGEPALRLVGRDQSESPDAECREFRRVRARTARVFRAFHRRAVAAEQRPSARARRSSIAGFCSKPEPQTSPIGGAAGVSRQFGKRGHEIVGIEAVKQGPAHDAHRVGNAARIHVAEKIGDERPISGFARKLGERASGQRRDENKWAIRRGHGPTSHGPSETHRGSRAPALALPRPCV